MRLIITAVIAILSLSSFAQKSPVVHKLFLYSGDSIEGTRLIYSTPILKAPVFQMDGENFQTDIVQFLQNNNGYLANLNKIYSDKSERYALRIKKGKMNLFEEIDMAFYGADELEIDKTIDESKQEMLATGTIFQYYNIGNGEVKKATLKNLRKDIDGVEAARKELNYHRNMKVLQFSLIAVGAGLITYGIIEQSGDDVRFSIPMAVGIVVGGSSYFLEKKKEDALWFAADAYNKN
ncbi:MAG: hypothetical protein ACOVMR_08195 [Flavobacteriales bacterium]